MLQTVTKRIRDTLAAGQRPMVVFDLDSTLVHTGSRHLAIARAFAVHEPDVLPHLTGLIATDFGWDVREPFLDCGLSGGLLDALLGFWRDRFFDGEWCAYDRPSAGAVAFVQAIAEAGAYVAYLTGRPEPTMGAGTHASLTQMGFPLGGNVSLHMKPTTALSDARFKRVAIHEIRQLGQIVATFENEPAHANAFFGAFPDAVHYLIGEVHDPGAPLPHKEVRKAIDFLLVEPR